MTPKNIEYQIREDKILGIVVEKYIRTVTPIGSNLIAQDYNLDLSPATIRNILAELEEKGYLTHPHTSAGRIPTQAGYRYYVDNLMHEIQLLEGEKQRIQHEYRQEASELELLMEKTSRVLSEITHYTSIVSIDGEDKMIYRGASLVVSHPDFQDINKIRDVLLALEEKERILQVINRHLANKIEIFIGQELDYSEIDNCSMVVSRYQKRGGPSGRIAVLGPTRMDYERVVSALDYIAELLNEKL